METLSKTSQISQIALLWIIALASCETSSSEKNICANYPADPRSEVATPQCPLKVKDLVIGRVLAGSRERPANHQLPAGINVTLASHGQTVARTNGLGFFLTSVFGLIISLAVPDGTELLLATGNSDTAHKAFQRYAATGMQTLIWMDAKITEESHSNAFLKSLANVRELHVQAANKAAQIGHRPWYDPDDYKAVKLDDEMWEAFKADLESSDIPQSQRSFSRKYHSYDALALPLNQFAMAMALFSFIGYIVMDPESVYVSNLPDEDLAGLLHLWAVIGYALGIDDEFNICLQPDVATARKYFIEIQEQYYNPSFFNLGHDAQVLTEALLGNFNRYLPPLGPPAILHIFLKQTLGIPVPHMRKLLSWPDYLVQEGFVDLWMVDSTNPKFGRDFYKALEVGMQGVVLTNFGPYFSQMEKAQNVLYFNSTEVTLE